MYKLQIFHQIDMIVEEYRQKMELLLIRVGIREKHGIPWRGSKMASIITSEIGLNYYLIMI